MSKQILLENRLTSLVERYENLHRELKEVDTLLCTVGFPEGLKSLKDIAEEMIFVKSLSDIIEEDESLEY